MTSSSAVRGQHAARGSRRRAAKATDGGAIQANSRQETAPGADVGDRAARGRRGRGDQQVRPGPGRRGAGGDQQRRGQAEVAQDEADEARRRGPTRKHHRRRGRAPSARACGTDFIPSMAISCSIPARGDARAPAARPPTPARSRPACGPRALDELVGQEHLLGDGLGAARGDRAGPPALDGPLRAAGHRARRRWRGSSPARADAALRGAQRRRRPGGRGARACSSARRERRRSAAERTVFFLDEIHRFNKAQQDALLPAVEEGLVTLIGATTENPYFEVNSALLSRTQVYELQRAERRGRRGAAAPRAGARRVGADGRRRRARVPGRARRRRRAHGAGRARARRARPHGGTVTLARRRGRAAAPGVRYDKGGDQHYDYDLGLDQGHARLGPRRRRSTTSR